MKGSETRLQNLVPVLDVQDVDESISFYCDALGFSVYDKIVWGGRTEWALLGSGQVRLMLCAGQPPDEDRQLASDGVFFVYLDDIEALNVYLGSKGYDIAAQGRDLKAGSRDFYVRDPDGYVLWFSHKPLKTSDTHVALNGSSRVTA